MSEALDIVRRHIAMAVPPYKTNHVQIFVDDLRTVRAALETQITPYQVAYAALWQIQSSTPALHEARKHILGVIGGIGSEGQRKALEWAVRNLPQPMDLEPQEAADCWAESDGALGEAQASSEGDGTHPNQMGSWS